MRRLLYQSDDSGFPYVHHIKASMWENVFIIFFFLEINKSMQANVSVTSHRDIYTTKGKQKEETRLYSDTSGGKCAPRGAPIAAYTVNMREICRHSRRELTLIMLMLSVILRECSALYVRFSFFVA